jgi:putative heme-binding domain-containing protein
MTDMYRGKWWLSIAALLAGNLLPAQQRPLSDFEAGARVFEANCTACHGAAGDAVQGVDFARGKFNRVSTREDLAGIISSGIPGTAMPPFEFRAREMASLLSYLSSVRDSALNPAVAGDAARGQALFEGKGGCLGCHRINGKGSRLGPDLSEIGLIRPASALEQSILDPDAVVLPEHLFCRAVTREGVTITGRRLNEDPNTVQLIDANERLISLTKPDLREYTLLRTSAMPSYRGKLSSGEVIDIVMFLSTRRGLSTR